MQMRESGHEWYDVMQVCLNGHGITSVAGSKPIHRENFCKQCGAQTIDSCQECRCPIRGYRHTPRVVDTRPVPVPKYCIGCGKPYPWQVAAIESLKEIVRGSKLTQAERDELDNTMLDVIRDTPKTESSSLKLRQLLEKMGKPLYDIALGVLTDVASETAKKTLGLYSK